MKAYQLRFENSYGLKFITRDMLCELFEELNSQHLVADRLGVSQMTISRAKVHLGIVHDGKILANKDNDKIKRQTDTSRELRSVDGYVNPNKGRKQSFEEIEKRVRHLRGKPTWNSGASNHIESKCEICNNIFMHSPKRNRRFCSRECSAVHMSELYSGGRLAGNKNPMYGKGDGQRKAWAEGKYINRKLPNHSNGIRTEYSGVMFRSTWEAQYAEHLDKLEYFWEYENKTFQLSAGTYTPDFYIIELDLYIEVKGWWYPGSKFKMFEFKHTYPEINILIEEDNKSWNII